LVSDAVADIANDIRRSVLGFGAILAGAASRPLGSRLVSRATAGLTGHDSRRNVSCDRAHVARHGLMRRHNAKSERRQNDEFLHGRCSPKFNQHDLNIMNCGN
jgi:hypothetical protein